MKNGVFGHGNGMGYGEHTIFIKLHYKDLTDEIEWDISNPDNQPEEFATDRKSTRLNSSHSQQSRMPSSA